MKSYMGRVAMLLMIVVAASACKDRDVEKKIAALEARMAQLEGKKPLNNQPSGIQVTPAGQATPGVQPVAPEQKPEGPLPILSFETTDHDFGTIKEGQVVEYTYAFKNTGEAPLIIQSAQGSCGCTVPQWSKDPIPVGGTGFVKAKFDSNGKPNIQNKTVTVTSNTYPKTTTLRFKAMVVPKSETPAK
jgi:hypothetical protein